MNKTNAIRFFVCGTYAHCSRLSRNAPNRRKYQSLNVISHVVSKPFKLLSTSKQSRININTCIKAGIFALTTLPL